MYDFDIRIHLTAMGPGIKPGTVVDVPATNVDLAPTILGLANVTGAADTVDGKSLVPFLVPSMHPADTTLPASVRAHLGTIPDEYQSNWRDSIFVEYYYVGITPQCDQGVPIEEPDNNFIAVRTFPTKRNPGLPDRLYAEFDTGTTGFMTFAQPKFYELWVAAHRMQLPSRHARCSPRYASLRQYPLPRMLACRRAYHRLLVLAGPHVHRSRFVGASRIPSDAVMAAA